MAGWASKKAPPMPTGGGRNPRTFHQVAIENSAAVVVVASEAWKWGTGAFIIS